MDTLPPEVRQMIYAECVKIRALGILYASKHFYDEFIPFLRAKFVLAFHIDPSASSTVVKLINSDNSPWGHTCTIDATSPHPDYGMLDRMPVDRFGGIRILVDAPDVDDPGQLIRGWLQSNRLVTVLLPRWTDSNRLPRTEADIRIPEARLTKRLPPFTIQIRDRKSQRWHVCGTWTRSIPNYSSWDPVTRTASISHGGANSDLEIILKPFSRIRYAEAMTVELPPNAPWERSMDDFQNFLTNTCTQMRSFGLDLGLEAEWNDDDILAFEDALHVWLDYLLDEMEGPTAALLRRDRFKFWCSEYECQMGRHFFGFVLDDREIGNAAGCLDDELIDHIKSTFHDRFMSAREHVIVAYANVLRRHGQYVYLHSHKGLLFWLCSQQVRRLQLRAEVGEDDTFWETCYPDGISPKSENDSWEDTALLAMEDRLEPPEHGERTACQYFPPFIGGCHSCDQDPMKRAVVRRFEEHVQNYLYGSTPRTH